MPTVYFYQSKKQELGTIIWSIKNYNFLKKYCDSIYLPKLPKTIWQKIENEHNFAKATKLLKDYLDNNPSLGIRKDAKQLAVSLWRKIEKDYFSKIKQLFKIKPSKRYACYLVKYGGGGLFYPPRTVFVRINSKNDIKYFTYAVAHELMHIFMDKEIQNMTQDKKEDRVDKALIKTGLFK